MVYQDVWTEWLKPVRMANPINSKLVRLDGMNLSHAWMLEGITAGLPKDDHHAKYGWG